MAFRCVHLYGSGQQCASEALAGSDFCEDHHENSPTPDRGEDHPFRKLVARGVAVILLLIFLIPFYYTLKALYAELPVTVEEGR